MANFVKQMRVRFSGLGQDSQEAADKKISQRRLPSQKSQSFKKGKGQQNWFKRQFSGDMSEDNYFSDSSEFATVIAAAAFAVNSVEEAKLQDRKKTSDRPPTSLIKIKSRNDLGQGEASMMKSSEMKDQITAEDATIKNKAPEKAVGRTSTMRTPSLADNHMNTTGPKLLETTVPPASYKYPRAENSEKPRNSTVYGEKDAVADAWEKAELERTWKKYERVNSTILSWETEKKTKAKRRLERVERDMDRRRERAMQHHRSEISRIDQIAEGARAAAEKKRRNEEAKIKETANKIRATGKVPVKCFCF